MRKLIYLVLLAATCSLMLNACKSKDKDHSDEEMEDLTLVVTTDTLA